MRAIASLIVLLAILVPAEAQATSQWSRKYGVACTTCHTAAIPRLNFYGEKFMRAGYQDVGTTDGDSTGKQAIGNRLFIDDIGNLLGVRLSVVPVRAKTNALEESPGEFSTSVDVGNTDFLQLFTAGSIAKNLSVFIETEINAKGEVHHSWFRLGLHNLFGTPALNAWVGLMDPLELHAASGRLPMIPPARHEVFFVRSSDGKGDDSVNLRSGKPAVALFGSLGPLVYEVGVDNGKSDKDVNTEKNVWATLRLEATSGPLEGSSVSLWGYLGTDSKSLKDANGAFTGTEKNRFYRVSPAANLRWQDLDVIVAWAYGRDDHWKLDGADTDNTFHGLLAQAGHPLAVDWYLAAQFDRIDSDDTPALELQKVALALSYQPRENWRVILMPRLDALRASAAHPRRQHELVTMIRTMF
jgi:hypothetical protein